MSLQPAGGRPRAAPEQCTWGLQMYEAISMLFYYLRAILIK